MTFLGGLGDLKIDISKEISNAIFYPNAILYLYRMLREKVNGGI